MAEDLSASSGHGPGSLRITARLMKRFLPGEWRGLVLGLAFLLSAALLTLLQPWPLKMVLDCVVGKTAAPAAIRSLGDSLEKVPFFAGHPGLALLTLLCAAILLIELFLEACNVFSTYVLNSVALRMVFKLRCALFDHVQRQSLSFHDSKAVGDSLYRITWDSYCIQSIFSEGVMPALTSGLTLCGIAVVILTIDWRVVAAAVFVAVPLVILARRLDGPMTEQSTRVHERESDVSTRVQETLTGIRAVQAFGREQYESERFRKHASASLLASLRLTVLQSASQAVVGVVLAAGTAVVIWISARDVLLGRLTAGDLVLFAAYVTMIFKPLETLAYTAGAVQNAAAGSQRVLQVLDSVSSVADLPGAVDLRDRARGELVFDSVVFGYRPDRPVLRGINLSVPAGTSVALVGTSGAGKTTLASLIPRFYDPARGCVKLDGRDVREITLKSLREQVALVTQEPILFAASIRENIEYGRPGASDAEIRTAARSAGAHEFIERLPGGYDAQIAERGATLSSGQRQRLAIARAFLKDAPVLILDEPTSALDAATEQRLMETLESLMRSRTTVVIAHRLSTVRRADRIVVIEDGRIEESGTHAQLLARRGAYAKLNELQSGGVEAAIAS